MAENWLKEQWHQIRGHAKWRLIEWMFGGGVLVTAVALVRATSLYWKVQILLFVISVIGFALAAFLQRGTTSRREAIQRKLVIHSANYRAIRGGGSEYDVTEFLRRISNGDSLVFEIENHNFVIRDQNFVPVDPLVGTPKRLSITYSYKGGPPSTIERYEHARFVLPEDSEIQRLRDVINQLKQQQVQAAPMATGTNPIPELRLRVLSLCSELQGFLATHGTEPRVESQPPESQNPFSRAGAMPWRAKFIGDYRLKFLESVPKMRDEIRVRAGMDSQFLNIAIETAANDPNGNVSAVRNLIKILWDMALEINA